MPDRADPCPQTFGQRVRRARERNGLTRAVLGGLVGRSAEWVKAIETGRLKMPRLPLLLRLADILGAEDLSELTGDERISAATYTKATHDDLPAVKATLTAYELATSDEEPEPADHLAERVRHAWKTWHSSSNHRTRIASLLPALLTDLQHAVRTLDGRDRRTARKLLASTYHLAQSFVAFQPAPELVWMTGDRAMQAAQDADDPHAIAAAAWYANHVWRAAGRPAEACVDLALGAASLLSPEDGEEDLARWGQLQLAAALACARGGRAGDAWRFWDKADRAVRSLGEGYVHPWLMFGRGVVDAYTITINTDLMRHGDAVTAAGRVDLSLIPSATRRSAYLTESARAYSMQGEDVATVHLLGKAYREAPETVRYNLFARSAVPELAVRGGAMIRDDVRDLAQKLGVTA